MESVFYRHSNKVPGLGLILGIVLGIGAATVSAGIVAIFLLYVPARFWMQVLVTFGLSIAVGWVTGHAMAWRKVRNTAVVALSGLLTTAVGWYLCWVVWVAGSLSGLGRDVSVTELLIHPRTLFYYIPHLDELGGWDRNLDPVLNVVKWGVRAIETAAILGLGAYFATIPMQEIFCESCENWCKYYYHLPFLARSKDDQTIKIAVERHQFGILSELERPQLSQQSWIAGEILSCGNCDQTHVLNIFAVSPKRKDTPNDLKRKFIVRNLVISKQESESIAKRFRSRQVDWNNSQLFAG